LNVNQINSYGKVPLTQTAAEAQARAQKASTLDMNDFLQLLSAQLANQDVMNPTDNTEFISQMAQFTSLQAMQTLSQLSFAQYGASLVGKNVLVAKYDRNGEYVEKQGVVEKINFSSGQNLITVDGEQYDLSSVMEVLSDKTSDETLKPETDSTEKISDKTLTPADEVKETV
jgi:flagellar basal-body rod modification protein FlgD